MWTIHFFYCNEGKWATWRGHTEGINMNYTTNAKKINDQLTKQKHITNAITKQIYDHKIWISTKRSADSKTPTRSLTTPAMRIVKALVCEITRKTDRLSAKVQRNVKHGRVTNVIERLILTKRVGELETSFWEAILPRWGFFINWISFKKSKHRA